MFPLQGSNICLVEDQFGIDVSKELPKRWNPASFEVQQGRVYIFKDRGIQSGLVLDPGDGNTEEAPSSFVAPSML
jgi:hypothetical protein